MLTIQHYNDLLIERYNYIFTYFTSKGVQCFVNKLWSRIEVLTDVKVWQIIGLNPMVCYAGSIIFRAAVRVPLPMSCIQDMCNAQFPQLISIVGKTTVGAKLKNKKGNFLFLLHWIVILKCKNKYCLNTRSIFICTWILLFCVYFIQICAVTWHKPAPAFSLCRSFL